MIKPIEEAAIQPIKPAQTPNIAKDISAAKQAGAAATTTAKTETPVTEMAKTITEMVDNSKNLVAALESVGAMYGIPSSHIIAKEDATGIRVENDTIIAPPVPAKNQTKPIIQAIGSVLDYISQRIDDKLDQYQMNNINDGRLETKMNSYDDPIKGKCIGVYNADDGSEIRAYDSGRVDVPPTEAGRAKVEELRASNTIPTFDPDADVKKPGDEYFNDEDIAAGIDTNASATQEADYIDFEVNNIPEKIQESAYHVNLISKYNNTTHLGYDVLTKHGFNFVKPIDSVVMESDVDESNTKISASDIKYLKFDNSGIKDAVKYFGKARAAQDNVKNGGMDIQKFINDPNYEKAIDALNKQFNCRINMRYSSTKGGDNVSTFALNKEYKKKLTVSKSKGFQLGGQPIDIFVSGHFFENASPSNELFGQTMVSVILHEMFHNIAAIMRSEAVNANMGLMMTMNVAASAKTAKDKRIIITNYVESIADSDNGNKIYNRAVKKKLIKNLTSLATVADNEKVAGEMRKSIGKTNPDEYINNLMKLYKDSTEKENKRQNSFKKKNIFGMVAAAATVIAGIVIPAGTITSIGAMTVGGLALLLNLGEYKTTKDSLEKIHAEYAKSNKFEEYYCDLFAGMYGLPITFFIGDKRYKMTANDFKSEDLNKLAQLEKEYHQMALSSYPSNLERNRAGVKIAKDLLANGDLDEPMKKYCQWIVDNFSNLENTNIDTIYNNTTYDPKEAENLDKHLEDLINDNNIVLTESYVQWMNDEEII